MFENDHNTVLTRKETTKSTKEEDTILREPILRSDRKREVLERKRQRERERERETEQERSKKGR
jgi:hypothetical protein